MRLGAVVIRMVPNVTFCRFWFVLAPITDHQIDQLQTKINFKIRRPLDGGATKLRKVCVSLHPAANWMQVCGLREKNHCHPLGGRVARKSSSIILPTVVIVNLIPHHGYH